MATPQPQPTTPSSQKSQTASDMIRHHFSEHDIHEFREAFNLLDSNGRGWIPTKQIQVVMRKLGQNPTEDALANIHNMVDPDGEGCVDFDGFLKCMAISTTRDLASEEEDLKQAFRCFDKTKDGNISADEFRYVMTHLGEKMTNKEINEMLAAIDLDGDGEITFDEFKNKMMGYKYPLRALLSDADNKPKEGTPDKVSKGKGKKQKAKLAEPEDTSEKM